MDTQHGMIRKYISIHSIDTLFFRDGKPFARGDETWADSTFPPSPTVIYGAIRTAFASSFIGEIAFKEIPSQLGADKFCIRNIFYKIDIGGGQYNYLPAPLDLVEYKHDVIIPKMKPHKVQALALRKNTSIIGSRKREIEYLLYPKDFAIAENLDSGVMNVMEINNYLQGILTEKNAYKLNEFVVNEPKIGIGRLNDTHAADDGLLYRVDMKRLNGIDIVVELDIHESFKTCDSTDAVLHLGGERKLVKMRMDNVSPISIQKPVLNGSLFKIYLATPAFFTRLGWQPDLEAVGVEARLIAASVGKPLNIGGFDLASNKPKPMLKAVPAGSVYYYESKMSPDILLEKLHGKSLSEYLPEQGYGISFVGQLNLENL
jgi:CRISPR-associated protein Cmr3